MSGGAPGPRLGETRWRDGQRFAPWPGPFPTPSAEAHEQWVFGPADAPAHPDLPRLLAEAFEAGADLLYGDLRLLGPDGRARPWLASPFDRTQLLARDYLGPLLAVRRSALQALAGPRPEAGGAALYDVALRAALAGLELRHLPAVLLTVDEDRAFAPAPDRRRVLEQALAAHDPTLEVRPGRAPGAWSTWRAFAEPPPITLVVPTMQGAGGRGRPHLATLLDSLERTRWPAARLTVLVGDDAPDEAPALYRAAERPYRLLRLPTPRPADEPFNFSAKMNRLWRAAETEHLVLLNDDVEVTDPLWLQALMGFAVEPDVGAVGARLLFPTGRLQHAGVACGLLGLCAHPWFDAEAARPTYGDWALLQREWSAVTGAVLATRRSVLEAVGGFDEAFSLDFNDVDLCLKMRVLGLRVVYTPAAELIHHEKASRGDHRMHPDQMALFLRRWRAWLDADPALPPGLNLASYDLAPANL